ncbi:MULTISPECIES: energy-coupling factor ABC transporter ATP-binding protein [Cohaesibacter]|uniref:energy-coupling factor ABC transporter ATP-binding protein n=1 Tax=Cohaesibacter TaxID=655352 RepID=UPI000DE94CFA|nr:MULTISPECIES: ABC transporter ATP-binding protein [Cohaesibacter]TLP49260.1 ABC transporter ATP-binding protein [Cohaesibacter sp. CAU 1516]
MAPLLETDNLHFGYHGFAPCLNGVSFALHAGERLGLVGHNGAGKSTLLHVLVGLNKASAGRIGAFGRDYQTEEDFRLLRRRVGLVFQDPDDQLFCPTVAEDVAFGPLNLGYSKEDAMSIVDETLAALNLTEFRDRVTHKLSGGQKRLVSLATVLAMKPDILLLDEPTNALDEKTRLRLIEILVSLPQAMIVVSHDRAFREDVVTRTILMEGGQIS